MLDERERERESEKCIPQSEREREREFSAIRERDIEEIHFFHNQGDRESVGSVEPKIYSFQNIQVIDPSLTQILHPRVNIGHLKPVNN